MQRAITVGADDTAKIFGEVDPVLTFQIIAGNLVNGDNITGSLVRVAGENGGTYAINQGSVVVNSNYNITYAIGTFTITRAAQTITFEALDPVRLFRTPDFQLTGTTTSGLPVIYTFSNVGSTTAATVSNTGFVELLAAGEILITASQSGNTNYLPAIAVQRNLVVFQGSSADLEGIVIEGERFDAPSNEIFYLIDCNDNQGFVEVELENTDSATFSPSETFRIETPRPGIYTQNITITSEDGSTTETYILTVERRFNFSDIVAQKYNNTLIVNNNPANNGGYNFTSYEWFKNGRSVSNEQFFSEGNNASDLLDPLAAYSVKMTTSEGQILQTCESGVELGSSFSLRILENPVINGNNLKVEADFPLSELENAVYHIYSEDGRLIQTIPVQGIVSEIELSTLLSSGFYRLILSTTQRKERANFIKN